MSFYITREMLMNNLIRNQTIELYLDQFINKITKKFSLFSENAIINHF